MKKIVQQEDPILRKIAKPFEVKEISSTSTQKIISEMFDSLTSQKDGVALAGPQIEHSRRIFVVAEHIFTESTVPPLVYINPEIIKRSKDKKNMEEGCLSCRWWYGKTKRASRVTVKAFDQDGNQFEHDATGLLAQIFQHEIDHLDGILFIDHAKSLKEIDPE